MMMGISLRAVIVDDERLQRDELRQMLGQHGDIEVVGEAGTVRQAAKLISDISPDVIFLDIQMPGGSGFDLLDLIDTDAGVIFITAYDEYAIRAFEINALDYLLKPVEPDRLALSIDRLCGRTESAADAKRPFRLSDNIYVKTGNRSGILRISRIVSITAAGDYSEVHTSDGKRMLVSKSMREWESRLPANLFQRIHRSIIVSIENIDHIVDHPNTTSEVYMKGETKPLRMSRRRKRMLRKKLR
jgi:two-component system LytT family response regulator